MDKHVNLSAKKKETHLQEVMTVSRIGRMRPFSRSSVFWLCFSGRWTPGQGAGELLRIVGGVRLPDPSGARQEEVWRGGTCEFTLHLETWLHAIKIKTESLLAIRTSPKPCPACSDWTGAGVPSQHFNAQQPDSGDDSWLHALQARAAAQPAERERRYRQRCSQSGVMSPNWTSITP